MGKEIFIDKLDMIRAMRDVETIKEMSVTLGHDSSVVSRWAKLYTVPHKGRERTIFEIVTSRSKHNCVKKVVTEEQIKEVARKSVTMQNLARNLEIEYSTLNKIIRSMRCSKTYEPLREVVKELLNSNRMVKYKSKRKYGCGFVPNRFVKNEGM